MTKTHSILLIAFAFSVQGCKSERTPEEVQAWIEQQVPDAIGLAEVEVTSIEEINEMPSDGDWYLEVNFQIIRSSGTSPSRITVVKTYGGLRPDGVPMPKPFGPVKPDSFQQGNKYWIAFSAVNDWNNYPQQVVEFWKAAEAPAILEDAIQLDYYAKQENSRAR